jgi:hypothetical protein
MNNTTRYSAKCKEIEKFVWGTYPEKSKKS